ncbi:hypothetical protein ACKWTF_001341 [Chironomus riparius]
MASKHENRHKSNFKEPQKFIPQLSAIGHDNEIEEIVTQRFIVIHYSRFTILISCDYNFLWDKNPYLIINQKKSHEDIHFHIPLHFTQYSDMLNMQSELYTTHVL